MGMYNEVFKKCPHCSRGVGYMQVKPQIVLGFGGFDLDRPETLSELDLEELKMLRESVQDDYFVCQSEDCRRSFRLLSEVDSDARKQIIKDLTS
jgi:hypothetical protein